MSKILKKILITGASLAMLSGIGISINNASDSAHADMPYPNYYRSTKYKDNAYYSINTLWDHDKKYHNYLVYAPMPKVMRSRSNLFGLYYGRRFHPMPYKVLHRHGQTYLPDYVGYTTGNGHVRIGGHNGSVLIIYVNKRDIGKLDRHQSRDSNNQKNFFKSQNQFIAPLKHAIRSSHHAKKHHTKHAKKSRLIKFKKGYHTYYARIYRVARI